MGIFAFKLPDIGEGVVEGEVVEWMVSVGDTVKEDDPILSVMTDKATVEIPSPTDGVVKSLVGEPGTILAVGQVCIEFETDGEGTPVEEAPEPVEEVVEEAPEPEPEPVEEEATPEPTPAPAPTPVVVAAPGARPLASPAVRQRARESGIDLSTVTGSGPAGRITHGDLESWKAAGSPVAAAGPARTAQTGTTEVPVIGLRRKISESMTESYTTIPHFSYFEEVDITHLDELRVHLNSTRSDGQPKLTYLPFIMQALVKALGDNPVCNALFDDDKGVVTRHDAVHLGIATQTDRGLYVPVVKHVEAQDIWQSASEMQRVSQAARDGTAGLDELTGSTFTITSLGRMGGLGATPIINKPEVGILGVHNAVDTPVVRNGQIVVRKMLRLSSSWDHRVVDGWDGAMLVQRLKALLENPATIFM
ncbi:MAG TPA: 2-oxo acid dehydrogenase subunit E2 [Candidatus Poseidoniales archaeon]|jgi:2-oxoisovalerate dehydrogenase E2 component (dihydrolipoyl transacylase)|nr:MAG TPA: 2-oxo acid dehydrogenase subunit E2 [Candidatus Poseidoniales archaeon]HIH58312.1 2-oxo acid dehydrogenase subunit E2 [Candidatus Poseidoniaceae archaeon]|tara:strand:+ start:5801 stop:7060 length:1260 start_codon:yes stop_codon:yes gene_type:complete